MASVASPPRPVGAALPPPVRHGTCRLTVHINGTEYTLRRMPPPEGFKAVWTLRKISPDGTACYTVAHAKGEDPRCTCPDHESRGSTCKHIMALAAHGLIALPKAARPVKARTRRIHAATARQAIAEAREKARQAIAAEKALTPEQRRHLAEMRVPEGWQLGGTGKAALASAAPAPAPAAPSFAAGFRQAVADHLARKNGTAAPDPTWPICAGCGAEFEPTASDDYCEDCLREGGAL